jgi:hypothetical protein
VKGAKTLAPIRRKAVPDFLKGGGTGRQPPGSALLRLASVGQNKKAKKDGIYRASQRGDSTYVRAQAEAVAVELLKGNARAEAGKQKPKVKLTA